MSLFSQETSIALILGLASFLFAVVWGSPLINFLRRRQIGDSIRLDGPQIHLSKVGTPTMGGVMIIVPTTIFCAAVIVPQYESLLLPMAMLIATGVLGALDDIAKIRQKQAGKPKEGVSARFKLIWQGITAVIAAVLLWHPQALDLGKVAIPFIPTLFELSWWFYIPIATLYIMGMSNATNLTDGMDGLAGGGWGDCLCQLWGDCPASGKCSLGGILFLYGRWHSCLLVVQRLPRPPHYG